MAAYTGNDFQYQMQRFEESKKRDKDREDRLRQELIRRQDHSGHPQAKFADERKKLASAAVAYSNMMQARREKGDRGY